MIFSWYIEQQLMKQYGNEQRRVNEHIKNMPGWKKALVGLGDGTVMGGIVVLTLAGIQYISSML
jgi:hypothetical protein